MKRIPSFLIVAGLCFVSAPLCGAQDPASQGAAILVVTKQSHALAIIDAQTLRIRARVPIGEDPHEVVVAPDGRTAIVSDFGEGTLHFLSVVDLVNAKPLPQIHITPLQGAHGLWVHGEEVWFTAAGSEALATLDPVNHHVTSVLGTGQQNTHMLWVSRDGVTVLASNAGSATMSLFRRTTVSPNVVPGAPQPPASYTHPEWVQTILPVGEKAEGFTVSPDETQAWVGNADGTISVLDLTAGRVTARFEAGTTGANRLRWTPDGARVLVTTHTGKDLIILDAHTRTVLKRVPIEERGASAIQLSPDGSRAFVACPRDHFVAVVDLTTLQRIATVDAGREPDGMTWWPGVK